MISFGQFYLIQLFYIIYMFYWRESDNFISCAKMMMKVVVKAKCYLDERHSHSILLDVLFNGVTHPDDELVRDHKDQDVGSLHRLDQVWNSPLTMGGIMGKHTDHMAPPNRENTAHGLIKGCCQVSPHWGAACVQADTSHFRGLC